MHASTLDRAALFQREPQAPVERAERRYARTEQNRVNVQADLVHEIGRDQRLRELTPSHEADAVPRPLLQIAHKLDGIPFHQFDARSVDGRERARENVGAHRRFLLLFRFRNFLAGGRRLCGGYLVGLAPHQDRVDVFEVLLHQQLDILAEVQPVERGIRSG